MRQRCTRCVGYLSGRTRQAMNKKARVHEAKLCICSAQFHVHLPPHWTKELYVGVMYTTPCVFFSFPQKVSGQQILERCIQDFIFGFVVDSYALARIQVQKIQLAWIPKCLPSFYFISREKLWKRDFFYCSPFFRKAPTRLS